MEYINPLKEGTKEAKVWDYLMSKMSEYLESDNPIDTDYDLHVKLDIGQSTINRAIKHLPEDVYRAFDKKRRDDRILKLQNIRRKQLKSKK